MDTNYTAPALEIIGTVHDLTLSAPGQAKIIGGDLDGTRLKIGRQTFLLGYS